MLEWPHSPPSPAMFVVIRQAGSFSPAECCSNPGIYSCQHSPVLLAEVLSGEREGSLAPSSPASIAGEKLVSECSETEDSVCAPCESGHYQPSWTKEKHCAPHDICESSKCSLCPLTPTCGDWGDWLPCPVSQLAHVPSAQMLASL